MIKLERIHSNLTKLTVGNKIIWFSYDTPIALKKGSQAPVAMRLNIWGITTAKHMKEIEKDYTCIHVSNEDFEEELDFLLW